MSSHTLLNRTVIFLAIWLKQGDAFLLPVRLSLNGSTLNATSVETVEFCVGGLRKLFPGEVSFSEETGMFFVPLSQQETLAFPPNRAVAVDVRVRFAGGNVLGSRKMQFAAVADAVSQEVI